MPRQRLIPACCEWIFRISGKSALQTGRQSPATGRPRAAQGARTRLHGSGRSRQRAASLGNGPRRGAEVRRAAGQSGAKRAGGRGSGMGKTLRCCWKEGWWGKMEEGKKCFGQGRPAGFAPPPQIKPNQNKTNPGGLLRSL